MTTVQHNSALADAPPPDAPAGARARLAMERIPRSLRMALYLSGGVAILSLARVLTGADQLTAEGTFRSALLLSMPIAMAGLGGLWSERAGVVNIGLEGMMVLGAWFGAYGAIAHGPWTGVLYGVLGGAAGGLLHAIVTVSFGVDHIISGVAINILGLGLTGFLTTVTDSWGDATKESPQIGENIVRVDLVPFLEEPLRQLADQNRFFLSDLADLILGLTVGINLLVVIAVLLFPITFYVLWRTPIGLRLRSVGEDPDAADSLGVKVYAMKYLAVTMSGAMAGFGGVLIVYLFAERFQTDPAGGRGFIGLAAMIFGNWRPGGLLLGAGLFGFTDAMQSQVEETAHALLIVAALGLGVLVLRALVLRRWTAAGIFAALSAGCVYWYASTDALPPQFVPYLPHLTTLLVLAFASQRLRMPAADGKVWRRSGR
jgi:simple sugar transport system permease protein